MDTFTDEQSLVGHNSAPIVEAARLCENGFSDLLESSSSPDYEKIEEGAARFRIWAGYLGIFADFHASLDYRVRDSELVKSLCLSQLRTLEDTIAQLMKPHLTTELQDQQVNIKTSQKFARLRSQLRKTFGRSSSSSKSRTIESEGIDDNHHGNLMEMLENTIDRLYRLAKEIRKPGSISKASKAERFAPLDEFGNDVVQSFERFTLDLVRVRLDGTKPFLQHRLAKANAARRRLFLYRLEHQEVLRYRHDHQHPHDVKKKQQFPPQDIHYNTSYIPTHPPNPSVSRKSQNKKTVAFGNPPPMPPTEVSARATTFVESEFRLSTSSKAPIADNGTSIRGVLGNGRLPAPPKIPAARKEFECKFCCQLIPAKFAKKNEWQKHLVRDLEPYVCIFEECPQAETRFRERETWLKHLGSHTSLWICQLPGHADKAKIQEFSSSADYIDHLQSHDTMDSLTTEQIELLKSKHATFDPEPIKTCPFCKKFSLDSKSKVNDEDALLNHQGSEGDRMTLVNHVVSHLMMIASYSLPWLDNDTNEDLESDQLKTTNSASTDTGSLAERLKNIEESLIFTDTDTVSSHPDTDEWAFTPKPQYPGPLEDETLASFIKASLTLDRTEQPLTSAAQDPGLSNDETSVPFTRAPSHPDTADLLAVAPGAQYLAPADKGGSMPSNPPGKKRSVRNEIKAHMMNQQHPDLQFLPETALKELFNIENIAKILESHKERLQSDISILLSYIETRATRIFAVLAWSQLEELIEEFFLYDFNDEKLPVRVEIDEEQNLIEAFSFRSRWLSVDEHPFNFNRWTERNIDAFCDHDQWPFLSPIFYEEKFRYEFHERTRMPFVDERPQSEKETLFSVVQEWRIHRDHIRNPHLIRLPNDPKDHPTVAVKRLKQLDLTDDEFKTLTEAEVDALETIRKLNHPHLVRAVAYYTRGKSHYIMFPWADQGNLRDIWVKDRPKLDEKFLQWVFSQLYGLAEAIKALHHSNKEKALRHGDLKPENILCFENLEKEQNNGFLSCILVVADVGSSRSHDNVTELRTNSTRTKIGTIKYKPPETELQPNEPLSRRYDIWSLGCIYLEFMIWLLYGPGGFVQFREDLNSLGENTRFYVVEGGLDLRNRTFRLNGVVQRWVDWIKEDKRCPHHTAMRRLLDLVVDRLLIADISRASSVFTRGTQQTVDSTATNPAPVPTIIIRQPLFEVDPADRLKSSRATAEELCDELMMILDDTTSKHLEWIDWSVSAQSGPGRFADRLGTTDN